MFDFKCATTTSKRDKRSPANRLSPCARNQHPIRGMRKCNASEPRLKVISNTKQSGQLQRLNRLV